MARPLFMEPAFIMIPGSGIIITQDPGPGDLTSVTIPGMAGVWDGDIIQAGLIMGLAIIHIGDTVAAGGVRPFITRPIGADGTAEQGLTAITGGHFM